MNLRTAPVVRVVGGLSLLLLCIQVGLQQNAVEWPEAPPPSLEDVAAVLDDAAPAARRLAAAPAPSTAPPAGFGLPASCGSSCGGVPAPVELSWGTGHAAAVAVPAPPADEAPPARGADVAVAFAQAAAQSTVPAMPEERSWPTSPGLPARPGTPSVQPVVSALFDPDPAQPLQPATDPVLPAATPPQADGTTPMAVPLDADALPEGAHAPSPGAPFKRSGQPGDKAGGRAPVPLAAPPVFHPYGTPGGSTGGGGTAPGPTGQASADAPGQPGAASDPGPGQPPTEFPGLPVEFPGHVPADLPDPAPGWLTPSLPPTLPLLEDPSVPDRVAAGEPQPGDNPLLTPRLEPVALPGDVLAAAVVSEPGALALLALAAMGLVATRRPTQRR